MGTLISEKSPDNFWNIGPIWLKIGRNDPPNGFKNRNTGNFDISIFCDFTGAKTQNFSHFGSNLAVFAR